MPTDTQPELFLIAHKVRGEPAFDIAQRCDDMGTESDPGPWWIIPTSGHRAYPYWTIEFVNLAIDTDGTWLLHSVPEMPPDWPDHYSTTAEPKRRFSGRDILATLGLGKPSTPSPPIRRL